MLTDGKQHILVVDDEPDLCEILRFNLEAEGYVVVVALSAEEALERVECFDLILLDVMMDRMSGYDFARLLRERGDRTPIIFLTARDTHDDEMLGFGVGADDYITKPYSFDSVLARVRAVLRRSGERRAESGQSSVVSGHGRLESGGWRAENLTRREYMIMELFERNMGRFFTREEIMAAVWPGDTLVGERSVDVHIARLRKKLGAEGQRIVNKTGFGYGLV